MRKLPWLPRSREEYCQNVKTPILHYLSQQYSSPKDIIWTSKTYRFRQIVSQILWGPEYMIVFFTVHVCVLFVMHSLLALFDVPLYKYNGNYLCMLDEHLDCIFGKVFFKKPLWSTYNYFAWVLLLSYVDANNENVTS